MESGLLLILSAPSGAGKTTLAHQLRESLGERCLFSVSYTTRSPRGAERDGVDYHFVDRARFEQMIGAGELLEWAEVHGNLYGSHRSFAKAARSGRVVVFDIDVQGGTLIKREHPEAASVFILPPSMEELERRLRCRATDAEEVICRRLEAALAEIEKGCTTYDYVVVNRHLEDAHADLLAIVRAESLRRAHADLRPFGLGLPRS
ncbi:MAG TPA: guanylate kinase [Myxococcales bacterium]|jgi:guanylate kinase|nr:guanylate kinase [Myxococcales bacterium]